MAKSENRSVRVEVVASSEGDSAPSITPSRSQRPIGVIVAGVSAVVATVVGLAMLAPDDGQDAAGDVRQSTTIPVPTTRPDAVTSDLAEPPVGLDTGSVIRAGDEFFALGSSEPLSVWQSNDGVSWAQLDIELRGSTSDFGQFTGLVYDDDGLSMVRLAGGGQIVHRLSSPDGVVWTRGERIELPGGGVRVPLDQTSASIALIDFQPVVSNPLSAMLESVVPSSELFDGVDLCAVERGSPTSLDLFACDGPPEPITVGEGDLRLGVSLDQVVGCAVAIQRSGSFANQSILVNGRAGPSLVPLEGGELVSWASLSRRYEFAFFIDVEPPLRRSGGALADNAANCDGLSPPPVTSTRTAPQIAVVDAAGAVRHLDLPDDADFSSPLAPNIGPQVVEAPDESGALVLLGDDVWHVDFTNEAWTKRARREATFTSSGQTVLSSNGGTLVLVGSTMRVGSIRTGEWVDLDVLLPARPEVIYVDDELALISSADGAFTRVDLPRFG